ncbi:MAG TPA: diaminobutyrate acetyltransferase, partial [Pseudomonas sp.]|nr:diaminobutyrate acetyltransferase [Pseudomonas sp.]
AFDRLDANCTTRTLFARDTHFAGQHEDEVLYRAGPFTVSHLEEELKEHA